MSIQSEITRIKEVRQNKRSDYEKLFNSIKQLVDFAKEVQNLRTNVAWNTIKQFFIVRTLILSDFF